MSRHHEAGKGSKRRSSSSEQNYAEGWERIFNNEYQDILSTEECVLSALEAVEKEEADKLSGGVK